MAKDSNGTLRLIAYIGSIILGVAAVWGAVRHNVADNTEDIKTIKEIDLPKIDEEKLDNTFSRCTWISRKKPTRNETRNSIRYSTRFLRNERQRSSCKDTQRD